MKKPVNVLVTAASRRVALIRAFASARKDGRIVVTDTDSLSPGRSFCDKHYTVPLSTSPEYIPSIKKICVKEKISVLIPTIDEELPLFGKHKNDFLKIGVRIPVSSEKVCDICNDKYKTYLFFRKNGLPVAETFLPSQLSRLKPKLPLFIKPRFGRGAVNAFPVKNEKELRFFLGYVKKPVIQKYLPGREFTVDVLCDFDGKVISVVPRERLVIRSGVSDRGRTEKNRKLIDSSIKVVEALGIVGAANLQCKLHGDEITYFEVNPRFSGAIQLTINAGANFPAMILEMLNGGVQPRIGEFVDNLTMVSYEESLYHHAKMPKTKK